MVLLLSRDLMFASRFGGAADRVGVKLQTKLSEAQVREQLAAGGVTGVLVDLEAPEVDIAALAETAREAGSRVVAYGPHVHVDRLAAAQEAGCEVMSRGQIDRSISEVLTRLSAS